MTPNSSSGYLTAAQFLAFYDARAVGDRLQDAGQTVPAQNVPADPNLAAVLQAASGMVESAVLRGGRYAPSDLQGLTGAGAAFLQKLTADIAWWILINRRPRAGEPAPAQCDLALQTLKDLQDGKRIFSLLEPAQAGGNIEIWNPVAGPVQPQYTPLTGSTGFARLTGDRSPN